MQPLVDLLVMPFAVLGYIVGSIVRAFGLGFLVGTKDIAFSKAAKRKPGDNSNAGT